MSLTSMWCHILAKQGLMATVCQKLQPCYIFSRKFLVIIYILCLRWENVSSPLPDVMTKHFGFIFQRCKDPKGTDSENTQNSAYCKYSKST